jgi:prevent-host-death family protein
MRAIGVRELSRRTSRVLRELRKGGSEIEVTHRGRVIARLVPVQRAPARPCSAGPWSTLERVAREIGARLPKGR